MVNAIRHIVFPGRFQPISVAHINRIQWLRQSFPTACLTVVIGDTGPFNRANFLSTSERAAIFEKVLAIRKIRGVDWVAVLGSGDGEEWARRVILAVPGVDAVASDNPFVIAPLSKMGLRTITYKREGIHASRLRERPFQEWGPSLPEGEWELLCGFGIGERLEILNDDEKYPFLEKSNGS